MSPHPPGQPPPDTVLPGKRDWKRPGNDQPPQVHEAMAALAVEFKGGVQGLSPYLWLAAAGLTLHLASQDRERLRERVHELRSSVENGKLTWGDVPWWPLSFDAADGSAAGRDAGARVARDGVRRTQKARRRGPKVRRPSSGSKNR